MHPVAKEKLLSKVMKLADRMTDKPDTKRRVKFYQSQERGIGYFLLGDAVDLFEEIAAELIGKVGDGKFSEKYIDDSLHGLISDIALSENREQARAHFDALINTLETYSTEQVVYLPLDGVELDKEEFQIGDISLRRMSGSNFDELLENMKVALYHTKNTPEEKDQFYEYQQRELMENIHGTVCAEFRVTAEPDKARELAELAVRKVIDLLRYSIPALYRDSTNVAIGLQGEDQLRPQHGIVISSNAQSVVYQKGVSGHLFSFKLSQDNIEHMTKLGVFEIANLLTKPDNALNPYERTLLRGIHWFAVSQTHDEKENRLLNLISCLETLVSPTEGSGIATPIAEGVAIIIGGTLEDKIKIRDRIKHFFKQRNPLTHGGIADISELELRDLEQIAGRLINILIERKDEFSSRDQLTDWLGRKRLGE